MMRLVTHFILLCSLLLSCSPPAFSQSEQYGRRFFIQLRAVFGRFRDADLERAFENAKPIQCAELINDPGEWRTVAFFNERRELGDWYRTSFDEVKTDLAVFTFKGICRGEHAPVQLTTRFPVRESLDAFNHRKITLDEVVVNVNAPVRASFDTRSQAYTFDLPYLYLTGIRDNENVYSLEPPQLVDRNKYATDVVDHWECKSVTAENVTHQFLICSTTAVPRKETERAGPRAFGASAYFILSDGKEASSNVKLSFDDGKTLEAAAEAVRPPPPAEWGVPDPDERLTNIFRNEFRIRFNPQSWPESSSDAKVLSRGQMLNLTSFTPSPGADYCIWLPSRAGVFREDVMYNVISHDQDGPSSTSIEVELWTPSGQRVGTLQCTFPRVSSAAGIHFDRWTAIVGHHLSVEVH
jgi:hypothetical protein